LEIVHDLNKRQSDLNINLKTLIGLTLITKNDLASPYLGKHLQIM
jgi:hypothetical protein